MELFLQTVGVFSLSALIGAVVGWSIVKAVFKYFSVDEIE